MYAHITQEIEGEPGYKYPGTLVFKYAEKAGVAIGTELGWTGGQSEATGGGKCTVSFEPSPSVAAGKEHDLFVLNAGAPNVVEFGPGGSGCPTASATTPSCLLYTSSACPRAIDPKSTARRTLRSVRSASMTAEMISQFSRR